MKDEPHFQQGNLSSKDGPESVTGSDIAIDQTAHEESTARMNASTYSHRTGLMVNKRRPTQNVSVRH